MSEFDYNGDSRLGELPPFISVLLPVRDEVNDLIKCLNALRRQNYLRERWELIVVVHGGGAADKVLDERGIYPLKKPGPRSLAFNAAARAAHGDILALLTPLAQPCREWLNHVAAAFREPHVDAVMGMLQSADGSPSSTLDIFTWQEFWFMNAMEDFYLKRIGIDPRNAAIRKIVFDNIGGFKEQTDLGLDYDLSFSLVQNKRRVFLSSGMLAYLRLPKDLSGLLSAAEKRGQEAVRIAQRRGSRKIGLAMHFQMPQIGRYPLDALPASRRPAALNRLEIFRSLAGPLLKVLVRRGPGPLALKLYRFLYRINWEIGALSQLSSS